MPHVEAIEIDGHFLLEYVCGAINAEMAKQREGREHAAINSGCEPA